MAIDVKWNGRAADFEQTTGREPGIGLVPINSGGMAVEAIVAARKAAAISGSNSGRVARSLGLDILAGTLPPGEKLPHEDILLDRYNISRTVIREAIKILSAKGLVYSKTRVGTVVRERHNWNFFDADVLAWRIDLGLDEALLLSLREARLAVEPFASRLAAERATSDDVSEMLDSISLMKQAVGDRQLFAAADLRFHRAVAAASGNFVLGSFAAVIETALVCATLLLPLENDDLHMEAVARHEELVDAISGHHPERAAQIMFEMISFGARVGDPPAKPGNVV